MSDVAIIGVGALVLMVCCSSLSSTLMMMGGNDTAKGSGGSGGSGGSCNAEYNKVVTGHSESLGFCNSVNDIIPTEVAFHGTYFSPKNPVRGADWIHELSSTTNKKEYIVSHQSPDNWCKMIRFEVTKNGDNCNYELLDAGYNTSPTDASTCSTKSGVLGHWAVKKDQIVANSNDEGGYGIETLKYDKNC